MDRFVVKPSVHSRVLLPKDNFEKFHDIVRQGLEEDELKKAYMYVAENVSPTPKGQLCPVRDAKEVHSMSKSSSCLSGGSLVNLNLAASSVSTVDVGKIAFILRNYNTSDVLLGAVGTIKVNCDAWDGAEFKD